MSGQVIAIQSYKGLIVAQDDKDDSKPPPIEVTEGPPPLVRMQSRQSRLEDHIAQQEAEDERELELYEIREKTKQLKGLFANRAYVDPDGKHFRISFGEKVADEDVFHTTIVIPLEEAYELGELLTRMGAAWLRVMWQQQRKFLDDNPALGVEPDKPNG